MSLYQQLNEYLIKNGIKQCYVSKKTGISDDRLSKILRGKRCFFADEFITICTALDLDPKMFIDKKAS